MARDIRTVRGLKGRMVAPSTFRVEHGDPGLDPMLWLPDQVLGAAGAALSGDGRFVAALGSALDSVHVRP